MEERAINFPVSSSCRMSRQHPPLLGRRCIGLYPPIGDALDVLVVPGSFHCFVLTRFPSFAFYCQFLWAWAIVSSFIHFSYSVMKFNLYRPLFSYLTFMTSSQIRNDTSNRCIQHRRCPIKTKRNHH